MFEEECVDIYILQVTAGSDESPHNTFFFSITYKLKGRTDKPKEKRFFIQDLSFLQCVHAKRNNEGTTSLGTRLSQNQESLQKV